MWPNSGLGHMSRTIQIKARVTKEKFDEIKNEISKLRGERISVTLSDIIRNGIDKELACIRQKEFTSSEYQSRETELWDLITGFLLDESKS